MPAGAFLAKLVDELGLVSVWQSSPDVKLLGAQRFVRLFAYGGATLVLAAYLSALDISDERIGLFMTLTLVGDVVISFFLTLFADALGRRAVLALGSTLMAGSGLVFGFFGNYWVLLAAAVVGVISPNGNEIGPFRAVEESTLAYLTPHEKLSDIFAWYSLIGTAGYALGMMTCGWVTDALVAVLGMGYLQVYRLVFLAYAAVGAIKLALTLALSRDVELVKNEPEPRSENQAEAEAAETRPLLADNQQAEAQPGESDAPAPEAQARSEPKLRSLISVLEKEVVSLVLRLFFLFSLDSFASGLAPHSWMTYFFKKKFDLSQGKLGSIFFTTSIIAAASMLVASSIAKRIGNVKTMVFTHLPSAVCLALIPIPDHLPLALTFLILRSCTQSMDVAPRSAFLAGAIPAEKRTAIMGAVNVVKTSSQSLGPFITGVLADNGMFGLSFTLAGILKAAYDIGMLISFAGREPTKSKPMTVEEALEDEAD